jgi:hypothetical protein
MANEFTTHREEVTDVDLRIAELQRKASEGHPAESYRNGPPPPSMAQLLQQFEQRLDELAAQIKRLEMNLGE